MVSKMIVTLHKLISRFKRRPKPLQMVGRWQRKQPKDDGVDAIYVQKASIEVAFNLFNNSPIACHNNNK
jgi:hypothetical protein